MFERILWVLLRRHQRRLLSNNFKASWNSYVSTNSTFGDNVRVGSKSYINNSTIGGFTYIQGARCSRVTIGNFCSIGPEALIGGLGVHPTDLLSTSPVFYSKKKQCGISFSQTDQILELPETTIGNDVWVGARAMILDGVVIGDGAIIAANAVISKNVPPYAIVGGVPGKIIRYRFSTEVINELLDFKWWLLDKKDLKKLVNYFNVTRSLEIEDIHEMRNIVSCS